ncbi:hypothetical protein KAR91_34810 [Candidatus Pacearchaeota archaeon]|nr:hypothetical protein [Candidatus Pacearchaeota archaeon]
MIIRLQSDNIPAEWEVIKFCLAKVNKVNKEDGYFNEILHELLNDKAQCWIRLDDSKAITSLSITKFTVNKFTDKKSLWIICTYSFVEADNNTWKEDWGVLEEFAINEDCSNIYFGSCNERIWELAILFGCNEDTRIFHKHI